MDQITITDLEIYGGHGVFSEETRNGQLFLVCAKLFLDVHAAGNQDNLDLTVNYGEVCRFLSAYLRENTFQLLEAAAEHLATAMLLAFPLVQEAVLEIKKPYAPIGLPLSHVSVCIRRGWKQVYLSIGSNLGDRQRLIEDAISALSQNTKIRELKTSKIITTAPYGGVEQEDFLNAVIALKTLMSPWELLDFLHLLEKQAGRERKVHWGPRTLDLDILFYEDFVSEEESLTVPHLDMKNRRFVLEPLKEVAPYYKDPVTGQCIEQLLQELNRREAR